MFIGEQAESAYFYRCYAYVPSGNISILANTKADAFVGKAHNNVDARFDESYQADYTLTNLDKTTTYVTNRAMTSMPTNWDTRTTWYHNGTVNPATNLVDYPTFWIHNPNGRKIVVNNAANAKSGKESAVSTYWNGVSVGLTKLATKEDNSKDSTTFYKIFD